MQTYDVLLTSYEMAIREKNHINRTQWCFIGQSTASTASPTEPQQHSTRIRMQHTVSLCLIDLLIAILCVHLQSWTRRTG